MSCSKILVIALLVIPFFSSGQEEILENFTLTQSENEIVVSFSIRGGASCNGVTLQRRTLEDSVFTNVGLIQGVCGGSEFTEHYTIEDNTPLLGMDNIYRLQLGLQGYSSEKSITVIELVNNFKVYPQPASSEVFIRFDNPNNEEVNLNIYNMNGAILLKDAVYTENSIYINGNALSAGIYLFQLSFESNKLITGRFIISDS